MFLMAPVKAGEPFGYSSQRVGQNRWAGASDWDGLGEKPLGGGDSSVDRYETVPEDRFYKYTLRDMPRGSQAWVREDALRLDASKHGWLKVDALICDKAMPEFPVRVTRWDGGYYVYPCRSFEQPDSTFIGGAPAYLPVKAFCYYKAGTYYITIEALPRSLEEQLQDNSNGVLFR
jgi:hypothetical protein